MMRFIGIGGLAVTVFLYGCATSSGGRQEAGPPATQDQSRAAGSDKATSEQAANASAAQPATAQSTTPSSPQSTTAAPTPPKSTRSGSGSAQPGQPPRTNGSKAPSQPATASSAPTSGKPTGAAAPSGAPKSGAAAAAPASTAQPATPPAGAAKATSLDLNGLEDRLRNTRAIGVFTKLSLKNQVDDLLGEFRTFHARKQPPLSQLRQQYDLLLIKVLSLLQDGDPPLAAEITSSREALWNILTDPQKFTKL